MPVAPDATPRAGSAPQSFRFPKTDRIVRKADFKRVFAQGEKVVGPQFVGYFVREDGQGCKLGLAVSRKVGSAVVRNRVKRNVREWYRTHRPQFLAELYLVIVARPGAAALRGPEAAAALTSLMQRKGVVT